MDEGAHPSWFQSKHLLVFFGMHEIPIERRDEYMVELMNLLMIESNRE
jgi:hypothetical protein